MLLRKARLREAAIATTLLSLVSSFSFLQIGRHIPSRQCHRNAKTRILFSSAINESPSISFNSSIPMQHEDADLLGSDGPEILPSIVSKALWGSSTSSSKTFNPYRSQVLFSSDIDWEDFLEYSHQQAQINEKYDPFWEQVKMEARAVLEKEPEAGPQVYQGILSQSSLLEAICTVICHRIETELISAPAIKNLFLENLSADDEGCIRLDLEAVSTRSPSVESAMHAILFHNGFQALVCYRLGSRLWRAGRTALAYYMQSKVSRIYSADIHPACTMGSSIYLRTGAGVVIGETAVVGNDTSLSEGVTLGGTGKERGDRHPKIGKGVIIQDGGTILGNIPVGDGAVVTAKSIVTKPVPPLAIVSGVPAKIIGYRELNKDAFDDDLQEHLVAKYLEEWKKMNSTRST